MPTKANTKVSKNDDDLPDSLFEDEKQPLQSKTTHRGPLNRSSTTDKVFSILAEEAMKDGLDFEDSDVSEADPTDMLKNLKDLDDMEADLFSFKKTSNTAPAPTKPPATGGLKKDSTSVKSPESPEGSDEATAGVKKPNSTPPSTARSYKKFPFADNNKGDDEHLGQTSDIKGLDDPLVDPLDDLLPDQTKPESKPPHTKPEKILPSASASPNLKNETPKMSKKNNFTFDDNKDDLIDVLGIDRDKNNPKKKETSFWSSKEKGDAPQRPRTRIDDILEGLTSPRPLERPPTGERSQERQQQEKNSSLKETLLNDDLSFGSYQPTVGSVPEGRQSRRPSVRFSTDDDGISASEKKTKPTTSRHRNSSNWLGLKTNDKSDFLGGPKEVKTSSESPKALSSPALERKPSLNGSQFTSLGKTAGDVQTESKQSKSEAPESQRKDDKDEDKWFAGLLSKKKSLSGSNTETKMSIPQDSLGMESTVSNQVTFSTPRDKEDTLPSIKETSPAAHSTPVREERPKQVPQHQAQSSSAATQDQVSLTADSLQQLLLQQQTQLLGLGGSVDAGVLQKLKEQQHGDQQALQARVIQLEGQVKMLQLELDQSQTLLKNIQQRHEQDLEFLENTHKTGVKLLEESAAKGATRARLECEELTERLAALTRSAEQERSELQDQYHRKVAQVQQDRDREVERLRDLQRKSILEMKKDHEDQLQRLKKLKDEEIDAVTSATSQTRSLAGVIEQMEQFSSRLGELASRVESAHEHTACGLEQGARHRDEQLRSTSDLHSLSVQIVLQDRLTQQQKAMVEERAYLKELISRMDTQLSEQQRQLEKERWKVTAEQAKADSSQRGLEDERRIVASQISVEREELERAKNALLDEQKSVMQHCAEERKKLAAEWAHFHTQEKQQRERAEREVNSLIERREGSIISLAQEQADLKLRTAELKQKETTVTQEKETLERLREELDREKERISNTALRLKTRSQEVEAFSKLAAERYEAGERALQEAKRVEAEHKVRLRNIHSRSEHLRQLEQRVLKERTRLNHLQTDAEKTRTSAVSPSPQTVPTILPDSVSVLLSPELTRSQNIPPFSASANNKSMTMEASLNLWKYNTEKDREFFQEEQIYLENLKTSYRLNTD